MFYLHLHIWVRAGWYFCCTCAAIIAAYCFEFIQGLCDANCMKLSISKTRVAAFTNKTNVLVTFCF